MQYEHRASVKLDRMDVINAFVDCIPTVPPPLAAGARHGLGSRALAQSFEDIASISAVGRNTANVMHPGNEAIHQPVGKPVNTLFVRLTAAVYRE